MLEMDTVNTLLIMVKYLWNVYPMAINAMLSFFSSPINENENQRLSDITYLNEIPWQIRSNTLMLITLL